MTLSSERTGNLYLGIDTFLKEVPEVGLVKFEVNGHTSGLGGDVTVSCDDQKKRFTYSLAKKY